MSLTWYTSGIMWTKQVDSRSPAPKQRNIERKISTRSRRRLPFCPPPWLLHFSSFRWTFRGSKPANSLSTARRIAEHILLTSSILTRHYRGEINWKNPRNIKWEHSNKCEKILPFGIEYLLNVVITFSLLFSWVMLSFFEVYPMMTTEFSPLIICHLYQIELKVVFFFGFALRTNKFLSVGMLNIRKRRVGELWSTWLG